MRLSLCGAFLLSAGLLFGADESVVLQSPNGKISTEISTTGQLCWTIKVGDQVVMAPSAIGMVLDNGVTVGKEAGVQRVQRSTTEESIVSPFYRFSSFDVTYNAVDLLLGNGYGVQFRAYNDGIAYRFYTQFDADYQVKSETAEFNFPQDYTTIIAYTPSHANDKKSPYANSFENLYNVLPLSKVDTKKLAFTPTAVCLDESRKLTIAESDVERYPGMFLRSKGNGFSGEFAPYPAAVSVASNKHQEYVDKGADFISKTDGKRTFPWRIVVYSEKDTELPTNNLVYALAAPSRVGDISWIKPGLAAWDWWSEWGVYDVDFNVGANTATYKYYIDFAARYGLPYFTMDASWFHIGGQDMLTTTDNVDLPEVVRYAKEKGVGIFMWTTFMILDNQLEEACKKYSAMGIKGFKVDFLDRDDQLAVERAYRVAETCAKYHLMLDFHGFYKPTGLNRTYPNVLNFEGVYGLEQFKWIDPKTDMPGYDVTIPFLRMMAGPMDYTPGAMHNANRGNFRSIYNEPMSQGTRCHQLAEYIVFDAPFAMLSDSPNAYDAEPEFTRFLASIPVDIHETKVLDGKIGEYVVMARRNGTSWFVGGLTNWNARKCTVDFSFLKEGKDYEAVIYKDGKNAHRKGMDYSVEKMTVSSKTKLDLSMSAGGGFAIRLYQK